MKKIVFRTFIYSFAFSLLVIFSINKLQAYSPQKNDKAPEIKISKNITSFLKEKPAMYQNTAPSPIEESSSSDVFEAEAIHSDNDITDIVTDDEIYTFDDSDNEELIANADDSILNQSTSQGKEDEAQVVYNGEANWQISGLEADVSLTPSNYSDDQAEPLVSSYTPDANNDFLDSDTSDYTIESKKDVLIPIQKNNKSAINDNVVIAKEASTNQVAMVKDELSLKGMTTDVNSDSDDKNGNKVDESPWVVAKGSKYANNGFVVEESLAQEKIKTVLDASPKPKVGEVKVAEMVRNILIPIPEDILKEGNLTPQLISSKRNKDLQEKIEQNVKEKTLDEDIIKEKVDEKKDGGADEGGDKKDKKTIFDSISSIFSGKTPAIGVSNNGEQKFGSTMDSVYTVKKNSKDKKNNKVTKILPTEIKLSFQPNRAEISGQTLKWIEAFANKTIEDGSVVLEIRIDGASSFELQQKRLGLLHNILINKGVEYNKINTVFTTREPNSFIIRTVRVNEKSVAMDSNPKINENSKHYQNW